MYEIINEAKPSPTVGDDLIRMDLIKQIPSLIARVMSHLFNVMVRQRKFPDSLKTARIIANKKKGKFKLNPESFCPILILNPLEKLLEDTMRLQLLD